MEVVLFATMAILAPLILFGIVAFLAHKQKQRVLAARADAALQAMLQAGEFLDVLAVNASLPEDLRRRAEALSRDYPKGDQLRIFAETLLTQLKRGTRQSSA